MVDWLLAAAPSIRPPEPAVTLNPSPDRLGLRTMLLASTFIDVVARFAPWRTAASTAEFTVFLAMAPLPPTSAALVESTLLLNIARWVASTSIEFAVSRWLSVPPPSSALVKLVLFVCALAAAPDTKPPLPDTAWAEVSSVPVALTLSMPPTLPVTPSPTVALVMLYVSASATLAPAATIPTVTPETSACVVSSFAARMIALFLIVSLVSPSISVLTLPLIAEWLMVALKPTNPPPAALAMLCAVRLLSLSGSRCAAVTVRLFAVMVLALPIFAVIVGATMAEAWEAPTDNKPTFKPSALAVASSVEVAPITMSSRVAMITLLPVWASAVVSMRIVASEPAPATPPPAPAVACAFTVSVALALTATV